MNIERVFEKLKKKFSGSVDMGIVRYFLFHGYMLFNFLDKTVCCIPKGILTKKKGSFCFRKVTVSNNQLLLQTNRELMQDDVLSFFYPSHYRVF